mmetsp:Transcript_38730/g.58901  ORF Transcript_38730/g.58901 Transcript_38730/m.58901 type:complete len:166 (+) Transcript_38730:646-1143(+)
MYGVPLENDSATSQGDKHMRVFSVDDAFPSFRQDPSLYTAFSERMIAEFTKLPDIASPEEAPRIMVRFHNGPTCEVLFSVSLNDVLTNKSERDPMSESSRRTHPNLQAYIDRLTRAKVEDNDFLSADEEPNNSMWKYLKSLNAPEMKVIIEGGFTFFYFQTTGEA